VTAKNRASTGFVAIHPLDPEDAAITAAMRAMTGSAKGARPGTQARGQFDAFSRSDMSVTIDVQHHVLPGFFRGESNHSA
jgi:hypothetical protein